MFILVCKGNARTGPNNHKNAEAKPTGHVLVIKFP